MKLKKLLIAGCLAGGAYALYWWWTAQAPAVTSLPPTPRATATPAYAPVEKRKNFLAVEGGVREHSLSNGPLRLRYRLTITGNAGGRIYLRIYSLRGKFLRSLIDEPARSMDNVIDWDGRDRDGNIMPSDIYQILLESPGWSDVIRVTVLR